VCWRVSFNSIAVNPILKNEARRKTFNSYKTFANAKDSFVLLNLAQANSGAEYFTTLQIDEFENILFTQSDRAGLSAIVTKLL
jgi:hypothetical protein